MSFSFKISGDTKAEAKENLVKLRHAQPPSVPHPLVELALTALDGVREDGPVVVEAYGHLATEDSYQVSEAHLRVGNASQLSQANSGAERHGPAIAKLEEQVKDARASVAEATKVVERHAARLDELTGLAADQAKLIEAQKAEIENLTGDAKAPMENASFEELSNEIRRRGGTVTPAPHAGNGEEQHPPGNPEE